MLCRTLLPSTACRSRNFEEDFLVEGYVRPSESEKYIENKLSGISNVRHILDRTGLYSNVCCPSPITLRFCLMAH
jgi:hypothetical protein